MPEWIYTLLGVIGAPAFMALLAFVNLTISGHFERCPSDRIWFR